MGATYGMSDRSRLWRRRRGAIVAALAAAPVMLAAALDLAFPPPLDQAVSHVVQDRRGRTLRAFPIEDGRWRLEADLDRIDERYIRALIAIEDERFLRHHGVDAAAVVRAAVHAARARRIV